MLTKNQFATLFAYDQNTLPYVLSDAVLDQALRLANASSELENAIILYARKFTFRNPTNNSSELGSFVNPNIFLTPVSTLDASPSSALGAAKSLVKTIAHELGHSRDSDVIYNKTDFSGPIGQLTFLYLYIAGEGKADFAALQAANQFGLNQNDQTVVNSSFFVDKLVNEASSLAEKISISASDISQRQYVPYYNNFWLSNGGKNPLEFSAATNAKYTLLKSGSVLFEVRQGDSPIDSIVFPNGNTLRPATGDVPQAPNGREVVLGRQLQKIFVPPSPSNSDVLFTSQNRQDIAVLLENAPETVLFSQPVKISEVVTTGFGSEAVVSSAGSTSTNFFQGFGKIVFGSGGNNITTDMSSDLSSVSVVDGGAGNNAITVAAGGKTVFYGGSYGTNSLKGPGNSGNTVRLVGGPSASSLQAHKDRPDLPSLGSPGGSSYKIDAGQGLAVMVGGAGTNEFTIVGSQGAIIWGGGGKSTYKFTGTPGIAVVHMDKPTAEKVASLDFSIRSALPDSKLQWTVIINPGKDDIVQLDGNDLKNVEKDNDGGYFVLKSAPTQSLTFTDIKNFASEYYGSEDIDGNYSTAFQTSTAHIDLTGLTDGDLGIHDTLPSFSAHAQWDFYGPGPNSTTNGSPNYYGGWYGLWESSNSPIYKELFGGAQPKADPTAHPVTGFNASEVSSIEATMQSAFAQYQAQWKPVHDTPTTINAGNQDGDTLTPNSSGDTLVAAGSDVNFALNATNSSTTIDNFGLSNNGTAGHIAFDASVSKTNLTVSTNSSGDILLTNAATGKTTIVTKALSDPDYAIADVRFADGTKWSSQALNDLSAAGTDNILWRGQSGETVVWQVQPDGSHTATYAGGTGTGVWTAIGYANGTGDGKSVVLWTNTTGDIYTWSLTNGTQTASAYIGSTGSTERWKVVGFSDAAGADKADILWRGSAGEVAIWHLDPKAAQPQQYVASMDPAQWSVAGFAQETDGHTDHILWRNTNGIVGLWTLKDGVPITQPVLGLRDMAYWSAAGFADDAAMPGREEILWRGAGGETELSIVTNGIMAASVALENRDPALWGVASFTNTVRNGEAEIVWRSTAGDTDVMRLQGAKMTNVSHLSPNVDQYWHVAG